MSNTDKPKGSLLVATYEMPKHLALVCAALERQTSQDFEILFCDDGSGPETAKVIEEFKSRVDIPVRHLRQEHQGFRKCRILNLAVREARGDVFIFLDGDCVPHKDYVRDHLSMQQKGTYLAGRRVELGPDLSEWLTPEHIRKGFFDRPRLQLLQSCLRGDTQHFQRSIRVPSSLLRGWLGMNRVDDMKGCNYSVARGHLEAINGFDEEYEGYGREDTDVELRLQNLGLKIKSLKGMALQYHVWHPRREFTPRNDQRLDELKNSGRFECRQGLKPS